LNEGPGSPLSRGICFSCRKDILGKIVDAQGKTYHPECHTCSKCRGYYRCINQLFKELLGTAEFFIDEKGKYLCDNCHSKTLPICFKCGKGIEGTYKEAVVFLFDISFIPTRVKISIHNTSDAPNATPF
jgi:hypothetical protein